MARGGEVLLYTIASMSGSESLCRAESIVRTEHFFVVIVLLGVGCWVLGVGYGKVVSIPPVVLYM